ncbi:hypothetical protein CA13_39690 [Planctomycetes bacterium CA13]|uniref:Uncharacterized protein n=1 Tax=Novipirellula herctigrandis TaxID=2527986 RepID=A0A5C5Z607_9BACT|nr:hypothetical protein CA13_39690 [Planctomycetes bacterium CA13]
MGHRSTTACTTLLKIASSAFWGLFLAFQCSISLGQLSDYDRARLVSQIEYSKNQIVAERFPDLETAKQEVLRRSNIVRGVMQTQTSKANGQEWLDYLEMAPITTAINDDASAAKLAYAAFDLRHRLVGNARGLEISVIRHLRDSVEDLISAIRFRDADKSVIQFQKQLDSLVERIEVLDRVPSAEDAAAIAAIVGLIDESGQAKEVVGVMKDVFGRPNVTVLVGEPIVQKLVNRAVNESKPVRDCILGTRIVGTAYTNGVVTANLLPSIGSARIQVALAGHVTTKSFGYNGPVRLRTTGNGDYSAWRTLNVNEQGVTLEPAVATAVLNTQIDAIEHRLRIVRRIAKKKSAEQKPLADRIALRKLEARVKDEFLQETNQASEIKPPDVSGRITPMLRRLSLEEPARLWGSTDEAIFIDATFRRGDQISTVVSKPPINAAYDVAVQFQESVVDNTLGPLLAGRTVKESEINQLLSRTDQQAVAKNSDDDDEATSFELDFARVQPIVFEARDGAVRLGLRGTRFAEGKRELKVAMEITAMYRPARMQDGRMVLLRDSEVDVDFPGRKKLSVSQSGLKRNIQKKFTEAFPETLLHRKIEIPATVKVDALRGREFRPTYIDARDGWLTIAVQ